MEDNGLEPMTEEAGNNGETSYTSEEAAQNPAHSDIEDPMLAELVKLWPQLDDQARHAQVASARSMAKRAQSEKRSESNS